MVEQGLTLLKRVDYCRWNWNLIRCQQVYMKGESIFLKIGGTCLAWTCVAYLGKLYHQILGTTGICDRSARISSKL